MMAFVAVALVMFASPSQAVHKNNGDLTCGNCHTMHSSQGGTNDAGMGASTGSFILLRSAGITDRSQMHNFCLTCHSQAGPNGGDQLPPLNTTPPKVHVTTNLNVQNGVNVTYEQHNFSSVGAGGDFEDCGMTFDGTDLLLPATDDGSTANAGLGKCHSLGSDSTVKPPGNNTAGSSDPTVNAQLGVGFSCSSCHDSHGTNSTASNIITPYRNLKFGTANKGANNLNNLGDFGTMVGYSQFGAGCTGSGGSGVSTTNCATGIATAAVDNMWPVYDSVRGNTEHQYNVVTNVTPNVGPGAGTDLANGNYVLMSLFCAQCHGAWHESISTGNMGAGTNNDWLRHPVNNIVDTACTTGAESGCSGGGVPIIADINHLNTVTTSAGTSPSRLPMAMPAGTPAYTYADGAAAGDVALARVFCLSCHFAHGGPNYDLLRWDYLSTVAAGTQVGKEVPSNVGCQTCHNR